MSRQKSASLGTAVSVTCLGDGCTRSQLLSLLWPPLAGSSVSFGFALGILVSCGKPLRTLSSPPDSGRATASVWKKPHPSPDLTAPRDLGPDPGGTRYHTCLQMCRAFAKSGRGGPWTRARQTRNKEQTARVSARGYFLVRLAAPVSPICSRLLEILLVEVRHGGPGKAPQTSDTVLCR